MGIGGGEGCLADATWTGVTGNDCGLCAEGNETTLVGVVEFDVVSGLVFPSTGCNTLSPLRPKMKNVFISVKKSKLKTITIILEGDTYKHLAVI